LRSETEAAIKVSTQVDVFYCEVDIASVEGVEECEGLEGTVYETRVVFGVDCVSGKGAGIFVL